MQAPPALEGLVRITRLSARSSPSSALRIAAPVATVVITLVAADVLRWVFPGGGVFLLLLVPVLLASIALGVQSGLIALFLGGVGAVLMVVLREHPWLTTPADVLRVVPYLLLGGFIVLVASVLRAAIRQDRAPEPAEASAALVEPLTSREAEVLALAASGLNTGQIADRLVLSRNTVKSHLAHAYGKLGAHNRVEAIGAALHSGLLRGSVVTARASQITAGFIRATAPEDRPPTGRAAGILPGRGQP
jgi:DNA-binding CsgD family transcriptional regulator